MFENGSCVYRYAITGHHGQADAFAEPRIANWKCGRLLYRSVAQCQRLDTGGMNVAAAADDNILLAAGDPEITCLVDPAEIAGHEPALRVECCFRRLLVVEIAKHQAGAT